MKIYSNYGYSQNISMKGAMPIKKTQSYYDEIGEAIKKGAAFYNEKTGNTLLIPPLDFDTLFSLWKGKMNGNPLFQGSMGDVIMSLGKAKQIMQMDKSGEIVYRRPNAMMPFVTRTNKCSKEEYLKELNALNN